MAIADVLERPRRAVERGAEGARRTYENLNERERKLAMLLGAIVVVFVVILPLYLMNSAITDLEDENRDIVEVLRDIDHSRGQVLQRQAERRAAMRLYEQKAPPLGSFLENEAKKQGITVREVTDQPEKDLGQYRRRHVRVTLPSVGLAAVVRMMAAIENSPYPVAIERIHVDHFRSGDQYNVQLGVVAYDKKGASQGSGAGAPEASASPRRARRPAPPRGGAQ